MEFAPFRVRTCRCGASAPIGAAGSVAPDAKQPLFDLVGTCHHISEKHVDRSVKRFAGCNNLRDLNTIGQMCAIVWPMTSERIKYAELIS